MKRMWLAYVGVTLLGVLVGVAIAGIPSGGNVAVSPIASIADGDTVDTAAATTIVTTTTAAEPETTTTSVAATSTTSTTTTSTSTSTPTTTTTTTSTTVPLPDRADIFVVAVNGANVAGLAGRTIELLADLGYTQSRATDGSVVAETTSIYYADGRAAEADRLADDIGLEDPLLFPIDENVPFNVLSGDELVLFVGRDRA